MYEGDGEEVWNERVSDKIDVGCSSWLHLYPIASPETAYSR